MHQHSVLRRVLRWKHVIPCGAAEYVAAVYAEMRMEEAQTEQPHSYTTARTLLSILRLSQALARLRLDDAVTQVSTVKDNESGHGVARAHSAGSLSLTAAWAGSAGAQ